jgi:hypothetical protein
MNNENLTLHFKVKDFNAWQTSYNGNEKNRTSAGITKSKVWRRRYLTRRSAESNRRAARIVRRAIDNRDRPGPARINRLLGDDILAREMCGLFI